MSPDDPQCAELSTRLLLGLAREEDLPKWRGMDWPSYLKLARKNVITLRVVDALEERGIRVENDKCAAAVQAERSRIENTLKHIRRISRAFSQAGIPCVFIKSFQHFSDMGDDIDLLVADSSPRIDALLKGELRAQSFPGTLLQRLSVESIYGLEDCAASVELLHGRLGLAGEYHSYPSLMIENCRTISIEGVEVPIPSPEDQLLNQVLHRMYGHFYIRISDFIGSALSLRSGELDWSYVTDIAGKMGIRKGLKAYCGYIQHIYQQVVGSPILPQPIPELGGGDGLDTVSFCKSYYRYPMLSVTTRLYSSKLASDLVSGRWSSVGRTSLIPLVASLRLGKALFGKKSRFFE